MLCCALLLSGGSAGSLTMPSFEEGFSSTVQEFVLLGEL